MFGSQQRDRLLSPCTSHTALPVPPSPQVLPNVPSSQACCRACRAKGTATANYCERERAQVGSGSRWLVLDCLLYRTGRTLLRALRGSSRLSTRPLSSGIRGSPQPTPAGQGCTLSAPLPRRCNCGMHLRPQQRQDREPASRGLRTSPQPRNQPSNGCVLLLCGIAPLAALAAVCLLW